MSDDKKAAIHARLIALERNGNGRLTAEAVIEDARNPNSPLHGEFEWDVNKAAYKLWTIVATRLITGHRSKPTITRAVYTPSSVPTYLRDPANKKVYIPITTVAKYEIKAVQVIKDEVDRMLRAIDRTKKIVSEIGRTSALIDLDKAALHLHKVIADRESETQQ